MSLDTVWGHSYPKKVLSSFVKTRKLPRALLLTGPLGVGKKTLAWAFVKELLGESKSLENCVDLLHLKPEGKNGEYRKAQIDQVVRFTQVRPSESFTKVCVIEEAEGLGELLTNSLLKTVEEPATSIVFILIAQGENALIPTLVSRTIKLQLSPLSFEEVKRYLVEQSVDEQEAKLLAKRSGGCLGQAKALMGKSSSEVHDISFELGKALYSQDVLTAIDLCKKVEKQVQEAAVTAQGFLQMLTVFFKDLYMVQEGLDKPLFFDRKKLKNIASTKPVDLRKTASSYHEAYQEMGMHLPIKTVVPYKVWS